MPSDDVIVKFTANGARIIKGVDAQQFVGMPDVAVNPDLSTVRGIPPHEWQLVDGKIVPKTVDTVPAEAKALNSDKRKLPVLKLLLGIAYVGVCIAFHLLLKHLGV
jgi:hypothetical protein